MDIRQLSVFIAVAEERNFTRAAMRLLTSQSAVSASIRSLERELGTDLFDRTLRQIELTGAAIALLPRARAALASVTEARDAVDAVTGGVSGTVRVGFMTSVTLANVPGLLGAFSSAYPGVRIVLRASERGSAGLADLLEAGALDIAFIADLPARRPNLRMAELDSSPLVVTVPARHPLAARRRVRLDELVAEPFIDFPVGYGNRGIIDRAFQRRGLVRDVRFETADIADGAALVSNGLGIAFLPEFLVAAYPALATVAVEEEHLALTVSVAVSTARSLSRAAQNLWNLATDAVPGG